MRKARTWLVLFVLVALATSVLAGCSSQPTQPTSTSPSTSEPAAAAKPKLVKEGEIIAGSDTSFPPFESLNGATPEGFDVDLLTAMGQEAGLKVTFQSEGFDTLIPTLKAGGKFDVIASAMTITDERKKEIDFTDPYIDSNQSIAVKKDSGIKDETQLTGKKIGVQSGTTGEAWAKENIKGATLVPYKAVTDAFAALQAGSVDAVVNDLPVSAYIVKDAARGLVIAKEIPTGEQYGYGVSKDNPELTKTLNDALAKLKANGKYNEIYKKWFGVEP